MREPIGNRLRIGSAEQRRSEESGQMPPAKKPAARRRTHRAKAPPESAQPPRSRQRSSASTRPSMPRRMRWRRCARTSAEGSAPVAETSTRTQKFVKEARRDSRQAEQGDRARLRAAAKAPHAFLPGESVEPTGTRRKATGRSTAKRTTGRSTASGDGTLDRQAERRTRNREADDGTLGHDAGRERPRTLDGQATTRSTRQVSAYRAPRARRPARTGCPPSPGRRPTARRDAMTEPPSSRTRSSVASKSAR